MCQEGNNGHDDWKNMTGAVQNINCLTQKDLESLLESRNARGLLKIEQAKNTCKCVQHRRTRKETRSYAQCWADEEKERNAQTVVVSSLLRDKSKGKKIACGARPVPRSGPDMKAQGRGENNAIQFLQTMPEIA
jgi:hypothetical protein